MTCEAVRERLAEHLLGTLEGSELADVRGHLRGCAACRAEMVALDDGLATFSRAAHDVEPPDALQRRVLGVIEEEWSAEPPRHRSRRLAIWFAGAATFLVLAGSVAWGLSSWITAERNETKAAKWDQFLGALGGEGIRVGTLRATGTQGLKGNVIVYDSETEEGQSWALVLVRAPDRPEGATVTLSNEDRMILLPELEFDEGGDAHTMLVTGSSLGSFDTATVTSNDGVVLAIASIPED